jgi:hypothetical protein
MRYAGHNTVRTADRPILGGGLDPVVTLSQQAAQLGVRLQTLYDLRSYGRGLRGFGWAVTFSSGIAACWAWARAASSGSPPASHYANLSEAGVQTAVAM